MADSSDSARPGARLRYHRVQAHLSQPELARLTQLSVRAIRDIEQDRVSRPQRRTTQRLTEVLGLPAGIWSPGGHGAGRAPGRPHRSISLEVLGPLEVRHGRDTIAVTAPMLRDLLSLLALHHNQIVDRSEIVDALWGEAPPASWSNLVHVYIRRLRERIEPHRPTHAPARVILAAGTGYRLSLAPDRLDLARFDTLAAQARQALERGDLDASYEGYARALGCWRGPVLAGSGPRLRQHPSAVAAHQRRVLAGLHFADVAVRAGRHAEAVAALSQLAYEEPLHEAVHARLMIALAGSGQQAAALRTFVAIRSRLAHDLGVDPAAELHRAYLQVLLQGAPVQDTGPAVTAADHSNGGLGREVRGHLGDGLYRCGVCTAGTALRVQMTRQRPVYRCPVAPHVARSVALVDRQVVGAVVARLSSPGAVGLLTRSGTDDAGAVDSLRTEAASIRAALNRMAADTALGLLDHDQLLAATAAGRGRLDAIEEAIRMAEPAPSLAALVGSADVAAAWRRLSAADQRRVLAALMVVTVAPAGRQVRGLHPPAVWITWR